MQKIIITFAFYKNHKKVILHFQIIQYFYIYERLHGQRLSVAVGDGTEAIS